MLLGLQVAVGPQKQTACLANHAHKQGEGSATVDLQEDLGEVVFQEKGVEPQQTAQFLGVDLDRVHDVRESVPTTCLSAEVHRFVMNVAVDAAEEAAGEHFDVAATLSAEAAHLAQKGQRQVHHRALQPQRYGLREYFEQQGFTLPRTVLDECLQHGLALLPVFRTLLVETVEHQHEKEISVVCLRLSPIGANRLRLSSTDRT
jgi:hypothetical protein